MLRTIRLRGHLGKKFGKEYKFDVSSAAEAVKALCHQVKGFKQYMQEGNGKDQKFKVIVNSITLEDHEKTMLLQSEGDISIVPVLKGSGGMFQTVVGAVLTAVGFYFQIPVVTAAGIALMTGGIMSMLAKTTIKNDTQETDTQRSYLFNGAVNTVQQGQPIPIGYGKLKIGSQVVSVNVSTAQVPV